MKNNIIKIVLIAVISVLSYSCEESVFTDDSNINLPVSTITEISNETPFVGDQITLEGTNMDVVTNVAVGPFVFKIISQNDDSMIVEVPRQIESGPITIINKYKREFTASDYITPKFYPAKVTAWPASIEKGKPFVLQGENMDLIKEVKVNGIVVSVFGASTSEKASFSSVGTNIEIGELTTIEMTPKTGDKQTSPGVIVVKPTTTYSSKQTLMIADFDAPFNPVTGDALTPFAYNTIDGQYGKALEVKAASGNGWNGIYLKVENDNNGGGYDLSAYNHPHITFLVNTAGGEGYVQPIITANGSTEDKHFTGAFGYGDDYKIHTSGWEWRSYDLEAMGFSVVKGKLDRIGIQFRGGNVNGTPFYIAVDQVMITDGPLTPTIAWNCETAAGSQWSILPTGMAGLEGYNQGANYASITAVSNEWDGTIGTASWNVAALDSAAYSNGLWVNFLLNTGAKQGYFQLDLGGGWMHFTGSQGYGDDYKFAPTNNKWVWRSIKINPGEGDLSNFDPSKDFEMKIECKGGNIPRATAMEVNVDSFIFTTAPLDPNLIPE
ncbi:hypothetical protein [Flavobacterium sp. 5]|uniref:hypothetical protein n=1 Tax=Flavobacterium sp. 5 TaxID=2035199 RepID=UPI000C2CE027|nr:hypothetical protein [Flavobacterium sp. 5]PKB17290.1 hypothetical protein CLU82_2486 [Flavobacterium sp. 5]